MYISSSANATQYKIAGTEFLFSFSETLFMNTERQQTQDNSQQANQGKESSENIHISQPQVERAEGPFEHSGETSGWTQEEKEEKEEQDRSGR